MGQPKGGGQARDQGRAEEQDDRLPEGLHAEDHHPESGAPQGHQQVSVVCPLVASCRAAPTPQPASTVLVRRTLKTVNKQKVLFVETFQFS